MHGMNVTLDPKRYVLVDAETGDLYEIRRDERSSDPVAWIEFVGRMTDGTGDRLIAKARAAEYARLVTERPTERPKP